MKISISKHGILTIFLAYSLPLSALAQKSGENSDEPNLLFIMTDQQRFDAMSCAGNTILETPNMDRIAREGVIFRNMYSANPVCVPARAVFLTGYSKARWHQSAYFYRRKTSRS